MGRFCDYVVWFGFSAKFTMDRLNSGSIHRNSLDTFPLRGYGLRRGGVLVFLTNTPKSMLDITRLGVVGLNGGTPALLYLQMLKSSLICVLLK